MTGKYLSNERNWATPALPNLPSEFTPQFPKTTGGFSALEAPTPPASGRQSCHEGRGRPSAGETLTVAEHLVIGELPVFGKKNPELEVHRALQ